MNPLYYAEVNNGAIHLRYLLLCRLALVLYDPT